MARENLPFVYIVESPNPRDLSDGRTEGRSLCETFRLSDTRHEYFLAVNEEEFVRAFDLSDEHSPLRRAIARLGIPIVHLSMHGNDQGICLTDGTMIDWESLLAILTPLNEGLERGLFVTLSTCGGAAAARMSMYTEDHRKPLYATLGSTQNIPWDDALVAYTVFYHNLFKLKSPATCVDLMRLASDHSSFQFYAGAEQKKAFIEFVNKQRLIAALTNDGDGR